MGCSHADDGKFIHITVLDDTAEVAFKAQCGVTRHATLALHDLVDPNIAKARADAQRLDVVLRHDFTG